LPRKLVWNNRQWRKRHGKNGGREDYSENGNAWDYFSHDQARSRLSLGRGWLAGISDDQQFLCFALALWNGQDPILKKRLFGAANARRIRVWQAADEIARRLCRIFLRGENGRRPVYGGSEKFQRDPHWRDLVLFYEYFHGDKGAGIGASHQTGWTGLVAWLIKSRAVVNPAEVLEKGFDAVAMKIRRSY